MSAVDQVTASARPLGANRVTSNGTSSASVPRPSATPNAGGSSASSMTAAATEASGSSAAAPVCASRVTVKRSASSSSSSSRVRTTACFSVSPAAKVSVAAATAV